MSDPAVIFLGVYGAFTVVGGLIGYLKAKSLPSLIAGVTCGGLLLVCAAMARADSRSVALIAGAALSLLLGLYFVRVWRVKRRVMPDLIMIGLSVMVFAVTVVTIIRERA